MATTKSQAEAITKILVRPSVARLTFSDTTEHIVITAPSAGQQIVFIAWAAVNTATTTLLRFFNASGGTSASNLIYVASIPSSGAGTVQFSYGLPCGDGNPLYIKAATAGNSCEVVVYYTIESI